MSKAAKKTGQTTSLAKLSEVEVKFFEIQLINLRKEIAERQQRVFRIVTGSLLVIPGLGSLAKEFDAGIVIFAIPTLVLIATIMFMSENNGIMRAGKFIRLKIEPFLGEMPKWETWLEREDDDDRRFTDKSLKNAFFILMFMYFLFSLYFAYQHTPQYITDNVKYGLLLAYFLAAVTVGIIYVKFAKYSSK